MKMRMRRVISTTLSAARRMLRWLMDAGLRERRPPVIISDDRIYYRGDKDVPRRPTKRS